MIQRLLKISKNQKEILKLEHALIDIYNKEVNYRRDNSWNWRFEEIV